MVYILGLWTIIKAFLLVLFFLLMAGLVAWGIISFLEGTKQ
jgi:hypothetical protein